MQQTFEQILLSLLQKYESNPEGDVEKMIAEECQAQGISEASVEKIKDSNQFIDKVQAKANELAEAKKRFVSTQKWLGKEVDTILSKNDTPEEEKIAITDAIEKTISEKTLNQITEGWIWNFYRK